MGIENNEDLEAIALGTEHRRRRPKTWLIVGSAIVAFGVVIGSVRSSQLRVRDARRKTDAALLAARTERTRFSQRVAEQSACVRALDAEIERDYQDAQSGQLVAAELVAEIGDLSLAVTRCERLLSQ